MAPHASRSLGDGGYRLGCSGLSELVRGREAQFLSKLEDDIRILDPATTELVDDLSQGYRAGLLNLATQLRDTAPTDERIHLGHHAAMDALPFQLEPTRQALSQPRARILVADAVGLGKTLEAGIMTSELVHRGRGKRILCTGGEVHARPVPAGVLEPLHHSAHAARLPGAGEGTRPHPGQPQPLPLLRPGDHLHRYPQAGYRVSPLPGAGPLGHHHHR
ncbi:MAG: hypothetical protein U5L98_09150 [Halomonas sp.]|uniref:hypothetical protein n=1 Tax=Halomonas sp. TaxID=1486246 RepID=UPI002ACD246D|nr:hypothetical protein [Halomonas sp.]MDZ7852789.1 hypothetical protein [Halomonas sp.]